MKKEKGYANVIIILAVIFASLVSLTEELNFYALYGAIPLAFILSFAKRGKLLINNYFRIFLLLYVWLLFTTFFARDTSMAFRELRQVLGAFLFSYIVSVGAYDNKIKPWMFIPFITLYISSIIYANTNIVYMGWDIGHDRMNDDVLNANKLAYYTFYSTIAFFFLADLTNKHKLISKAFRILFLTMIPLSFWVAIMTASRQVLIIQIPTILILGYLRYFSHKKMKSVAIASLVVIVFFFYAADRLIAIYNESYLKQRNEVAIADDSRTKLLENAIQIGMDNPIVGVGPGNFGLVSFDGRYSHNTYAEIFANTGIMGFLLYTIMLLRLLFVNFRRYRKTKDKQYLVYVSFAVIFIFYNFFYVFYKDIWLIAFFFLVASDSESYYKKQISIKRNAAPR